MKSLLSKILRGSYTAALMGTLACATVSATDVDVIDVMTLDENGLTFADGSRTKFSNNINGRTFQKQNALTTFNGWQYATYYDENRHVVLARRKLPDGAWDRIRFTDYNITSSDAHNVTVVGISEGDGTIHLAFDHHAHDLNYRVSEVGAATSPDSVTWDASLFSSVTDRLGAVGKLTRVTYPRFFNAPNGNLMLYYRHRGSGNGDGMIYEYDATTHDWTLGMGKFISSTGVYSGALSSGSTSRNPYLNGIFYAGDRIHVTWGWRESAGGSANNHDVNYAYSDDNGRTWYNNAGFQIGTTGSSFITIDSPGLIVGAIPQNEGLSNQYTSYFYPDGRAHVMVQHNNLYEHYFRTTDGNWDFEVLPFAGSRPDMIGDVDGNLFLVYSAGGRLKIAKGTKNATGTAWTWEVIYTRNDATEMGEGILDLGRWKDDRVLSVFGQERPAQQLDYGSGAMIDGMPAPVHVIDFHVSSSAVLPLPHDNASSIPADTKLAWTSGQGATGHRVYLGTDMATVEAADTNSPEYLGDTAVPEHTPDSLAADMTYYWRVDQVLPDESVIVGDVWSFTTEVGDVEGSWAGYAYANANLDVDTENFLGWINVALMDYVWSYAVEGWFYLPEEYVSDTGSWFFIYQ